MGESATVDNMTASPDSDSTVPAAAGGRVVFGRYTLDRIIGRGGMGVVWLAQDSKLDLPVALKYLPDEVRSDPDALRDLRRETKRALRLTHENIVRVHTLEEDAVSAAIVMEFVDGRSLSAWKAEREHGCVDADSLLPLVQQLCSALGYAHATAGIVHRDLKPGNLLLAKDGTLKVADFGIARSLQETHTRLTAGTGTTSGTLLYMSPQQMMGEKATPADDIYSLGATLYDLLTGKPPFYTGDVFQQVRGSPPTALGQRRSELENSGKPIPPEWEATVLACLEKDAARRPRTALDVLARLTGKVPAPPAEVIPSGDETVVIPAGGKLPPLPERSTPSAQETIKGGPPTLPPAVEPKKPTVESVAPWLLALKRRRGALLAAAAALVAVILALIFWPKSVTKIAPPEKGIVTPGIIPAGEAREFYVTVDPVSAAAHLWLGPQSDVAVPPDGRAVLKDLPDGEHELVVQASGYQPITTRVSVKSGRGSYNVNLVSLKGAVEIVARANTTLTAINDQGKSFKLGEVSRTGSLLSENFLSIGKYTLKATHPDCSPVDIPVELQIGRVTRVEVPQVPLPAELRIFSVPNAELYVNGERRGSTPATLASQPSEVPIKIEVFQPGYRRITQTVTLKPREVRSADVGTLVAESGKLNLRFANPDLRLDRGRLLIDGKTADIGRYSIGAPLVLEGLDVGDHTVEISHPDYEPWRQTANVRDQVTANVDVQLTPKPGKLVLRINPKNAVLTVDGKQVQASETGITVPAGVSLNLKASALGYKTTTRNLSVSPNGSQTWDVTLEKLRGIDPGQPWTISDLGMTFMPVAPGTFTMGSERSRNTRPLTQVRITRLYWLGKTEVRQKEFTAIMGNNPSKLKGENFPVEQVTWTEALDFCRRLTEREMAAGRLPEGYAYTLPTEAQWEYAARAGAAGDQAGFVDEMAWDDQNSGKRSHDVGMKRPNAWGLHDMLGNVWEWCADVYGKYPGGTVADYAGPNGEGSGLHLPLLRSNSSARVLRGGSWDDSPEDLTFAMRKDEKVAERSVIIGFRVALVLTH